MHRPTKLKMTDLNPHLTCVLCDGYFVDATTIVECLHSFCRACIVKYLETNKFCPICDVQVHKTMPLRSIRSDKTLQDVVYKLVPGLYQNEMKRRREFYAEHEAEALRCTSEERGEGADHRFIYTPDETISLSLEYGAGKESPSANGVTEEAEEEEQVAPKRYLQCPAAITVGHLKKFIHAKYALPSQYTVEIAYSGDVLNEDYTLMDIAYIYAWRRSGPMRFFYRVNRHPAKRLKTVHRVPEVKEVKESVPVIKEKEPESPKKESSQVPTLRLLPSPSSVPHEFKFVLKTISPKKEKKDSKSIESSSSDPSAAAPRVPAAVEPAEASVASTSSSTSAPESSIAPSSSARHPPQSQLFLALTSSLPSQVQTLPKDTAVTCHAPTVSSSLVTVDNKSNSCTSTVVSTRTVVSAVSSQPLVAKPAVSSKRATRSRGVKSKFVQRPLAKLAPYPTPRTSSPTVNNQVNHFQSPSVTCYTAAPASCLSTPPVSCLGAVSVSYLPTAPVTCFGANAVNGAANLNVSSLVPQTLNNVPITTSFSGLPVINPSTQSTTVSTVTTSTNEIQASKPSVVANSSLSVSVTTNVPRTVTSVSAPVVSSISMPVSSSPLLTKTQAADCGSTAEPTVKTSTANATPLPVPSPSPSPKVRKKEKLSKKSVDSQPALPPPPPVPVTKEVDSPVSSATETVTSTSLPVTSQPAIAPSMPIIPVNVPSLNSYIPSSISSPVTNKPATPKSSSVSFSVNSLLPNVVGSPKTTEPKSTAPTETGSVFLNSPIAQAPTNALNPLKIAESSQSKPTELVSEVPTQKLTIPDTSIHLLPPSTASPEKNSINEPFKEVKSSITAEFSDNDDLGCQPDLVVDEQKIDSSDNEDDTEDALRRKIKAIAEKEDEVDVDIETDSGRASDISNQARSSCDDDIGSPLAAVRLSEAAANLPQTSSVSTLSTNSVPPVVSASPHKIEDKLQSSAKPNGIDHIISTLHRNHERKDSFGALDLSTSYRKPGDEAAPRPRQRPVANPPVLDAKHRQQTCLPAPKQHTACVPAPKHPTSSTFPIGPLSTTGRHSMLPAAAASAPNHLSKLSPVTIPHFTPSPIISSLHVKGNNMTHFGRTPPMPVPTSALNSYPSKPGVNFRQGNSTHARSHNNCSSPSNPCKSPCTTSPTNGRREAASPRNCTLSPSLPTSPHQRLSASPHQRLSPCVTPPKPPPTLPSHYNSIPPLVPSTSSYKVTRPPIPIYKKSDSYKNSSHHNRFKGKNFSVVSQDHTKLLIKNLNSRPNTHNNHNRL